MSEYLLGKEDFEGFYQLYLYAFNRNDEPAKREALKASRENYIADSLAFRFKLTFMALISK